MKINCNYDKIETKNLDNRIRDIDELPLFLGIKDVMCLNNIGRNSAYNTFHSADFPMFTIGGKLQVKKHDYLEWLQKKINRRM